MERAAEYDIIDTMKNGNGGCVLRDYTLFAFDLDGTMLQKDGSLSPRTIAACQEAAARGIELVPTTGRLLGFLPKSLTDLPFIRYAVTSNGAAVYDILSEKRLYSCLLPWQQAIDILDLLREFPVYVEIYAEGRPVVRQGDPARAFEVYGFPEYKGLYLKKNYLQVQSLREYIKEGQVCPEKINLPYVPEGLRQELRRLLLQQEGLNLVSSVFDNLEINAAGCHKGNGLAALCQILGIDREHTAAIGDNGNDREMLEYAGLSIAMGNATPEIKKIAGAVTASCEEDGAALAIEKYLLKKSGCDMA